MSQIFGNFADLTVQMVIMWIIGGVMIYLAIKKEMEPTLLLPMGFGCILCNMPNSGMVHTLQILFQAGVDNELFPLLLFIGIGAMIDFGPLLADPKLLLFGAAAQFGIFFTLSMASLFGLSCATRRPSPSSARRTARPPSSWRRRSRATTRRPSSWRRIPTWRWCRSCSPSASVWSPPRKSA